MISGVKRRFRPLATTWLTVVWVLLVGEITVRSVLMGVLVGLGITLALPLPAFPREGKQLHFPALATLLMIFAKDLVLSSVRVAVLALRPSPPPPSALIVVPMRVRDDLIFSLAVSLLNLQPGGTVTDLDVTNRKLTIHILDGSSEKAIAADIARVTDMERRLIAIFETPGSAHE